MVATINYSIGFAIDFTFVALTMLIVVYFVALQVFEDSYEAVKLKALFALLSLMSTLVPISCSHKHAFLLPPH